MCSKVVRVYASEATNDHSILLLGTQKHDTHKCDFIAFVWKTINYHIVL